MFIFIPPIDVLGVIIPPATVIVGVVFVLRDYAQRAVGHMIFPAMVVGAGLSYLLIDPTIAVVSAVAFSASELVDYIVFTITKKPFHKRLFISSLCAVPVDTIMFLVGINHFSWPAVAVMVASKMFASVVIYQYYETRGRHASN